MFEYKPQGVCSMLIRFDIDDETQVIKDVEFVGGCSGNTQGISKLVKGLKVDEVIEKLEGIRCGYRATSCPDQLAQALKKYKESRN